MSIMAGVVEKTLILWQSTWVGLGSYNCCFLWNLGSIQNFTGHVVLGDLIDNGT